MLGDQLSDSVGGLLWLLWRFAFTCNPYPSPSPGEGSGLGARREGGAAKLLKLESSVEIVASTNVETP